MLYALDMEFVSILTCGAAGLWWGGRRRVTWQNGTGELMATGQHLESQHPFSGRADTAKGRRFISERVGCSDGTRQFLSKERCRYEERVHLATGMERGA